MSIVNRTKRYFVIKNWTLETKQQKEQQANNCKYNKSDRSETLKVFVDLKKVSFPKTRYPQSPNNGITGW